MPLRTRLAQNGVPASVVYQMIKDVRALDSTPV